MKAKFKEKKLDNSFILDLQKEGINTSKKEEILSKIIKFFNSHNKRLKMKFKDDNLNRYFNLKHSEFDSQENLLEGNMMNIEQTMNIYHLLVQVILLKIPGEIVELGCFKGITAVMMQKTLDQYKSKKKIHVYDSFQGLPEKFPQDGGTYFKKGFCHSKKEDLINNFKRFKVKLPLIHEGWFEDTLPKELPAEVCFAHIDGDFYSSTKQGLKYIYPKLSRGAIVVIDDYCDPKIHDVHNILPGVKKACDEFFKDKKEKVHMLISGWQSHGFFRKE